MGFHHGVFRSCIAHGNHHSCELPVNRSVCRGATFRKAFIHILIPFVLFSGFLGIFLGTVCRETQVLAVGNIYVIASPLLGGAWMDLNILGETLKKITDFNGFLTLFSCHRSFPYCIVGPPGSCLDSPGSCLSVCPCIFYSGGILFSQKNEIR